MGAPPAPPPQVWGSPQARRPKPKRGRGQTILIVGLLVGIPLLLVGGAVVAYMVFGIGGTVSSGPTGQANSSEGVPVAKVEKAVEGLGYTCYETLQEPVAVHSCYLMTPDGAQLAVRLQAGRGGETISVELDGRQSDGPGGTQPRGDLVPPSKEVLEVISEAVLGQQAADLPEIETGSSPPQWLPWGSVKLTALPEHSTASFLRANSEREVDKSDLPASVADIEQGLAETGFSCDGDCTKDADGTAVAARIRSDEVRVTIERSPGRVTDGVVRSQVQVVLEQLLEGSDRSQATSWATTQVNPEHGAVQGDAGGLHIEIERDGSSGAEIVFQAAQPSL
ncbi:MAG: hypothetical protein ACRDP8_14525 [Actinopolymorphaceae bacterium]